MLIALIAAVCLLHLNEVHFIILLRPLVRVRTEGQLFIAVA